MVCLPGKSIPSLALWENWFWLCHIQTAEEAGDVHSLGPFIPQVYPNLNRKSGGIYRKRKTNLTALPHSAFLHSASICFLCYRPSTHPSIRHPPASHYLPTVLLASSAYSSSHPFPIHPSLLPSVLSSAWTLDVFQVWGAVGLKNTFFTVFWLRSKSSQNKLTTRQMWKSGRN